MNIKSINSKIESFGNIKRLYSPVHVYTVLTIEAAVHEVAPSFNCYHNMIIVHKVAPDHYCDFREQCCCRYK